MYVNKFMQIKQSLQFKGRESLKNETQSKFIYLFVYKGKSFGDFTLFT